MFYLLQPLDHQIVTQRLSDCHPRLLDAPLALQLIHLNSSDLIALIPSKVDVPWHQGRQAVYLHILTIHCMYCFYVNDSTGN